MGYITGTVNACYPVAVVILSRKKTVWCKWVQNLKENMLIFQCRINVFFKN